MSNYRPVSLTSSFAELLEKLMYSRNYAFLTKRNLLYEYQHGFRKGHRTKVATLDLVTMLEWG